MAPFKTIEAEFDGCSYPIIIGHAVIDKLLIHLQKSTENKKLMMVSDVYFENRIAGEIIQTLEDAGYDIYSYYMNAGKGNKNFNEILKIYGILEENNLARDSTLIAVGGGVIGDLAGFVASTWLRGMNLVHIPTTLMAMVDSSVGGKVAINYRQTINAIGNYYHPTLNLMDLDLIDKLLERDYKSGIAEVIKCGIIADKELYKYLEENSVAILERSSKHVTHIISRALEIKIDHVKGDVREGGKRLLLNYGHTMGHSIEISTAIDHEEQYRHGEGVSIGIMTAAFVAKEYLGIPDSVYNSYKALFELYGLPTFVDSASLGFERKKLIAECIQNVKKDKKRINNNLRVILADNVGHAEVYANVPFSIIESSFEHIVR